MARIAAYIALVFAAPFVVILAASVLPTGFWLPLGLLCWLGLLKWWANRGVDDGLAELEDYANYAPIIDRDGGY